MRRIVVTKFGNEPDLFGNDLRHGMLGEWECLKLLKVLSEDKDNSVFYYGKAIWNNDKAKEYFTNEVMYLDSSLHSPSTLTKMHKVDEFHIVLGPHQIYNAGKNVPSWESIKSSIVTNRILERVAPQIEFMNLNPDAKLFFYLSDRRFLLQAADLENLPEDIYAQSLTDTTYVTPSLKSNDYTSFDTEVIGVEPFRFETLWLYGRDITEYYANCDIQDRPYSLVIPANQVVSDEEFSKSRFRKIDEFTDFIDDYIVCGKWTHEEAVESFKHNSIRDQLLEGLPCEKYEELLGLCEYALVLFNTEDGPKCFKDNWLTVKYWECVYNGCITFVERGNVLLPFIPEELQVFDGYELHSKIQRCQNDLKYKNMLRQLQNNLVLPEYFSGEYFNNWVTEKRGE